MKKKLLSLCLAIIGCGSLYAQGSLTFTTDAPAGTRIRILANVKSSVNPIYIDYGNGVAVPYTIDPSMAAYNRWIEGTIEGQTITVTGDITEFELEDAQLTSAKVNGMIYLSKLELANNSMKQFELQSETPLQLLDLRHNELINNTVDNPTLSLEFAGKTLQNLNLSYNTGLVCLDMRDLKVLEYLTMNDCPELGSVFICLPEESHKALRQINLNNCSLMHFYPVSLPALTSLSLSDNKLMTTADTDPFVLGNYPSLTSLNVSNNINIDYLDVTSCTKLTSLAASGNKLTSIDLSQCPELLSLSLSDNNIASLDLGNNTLLQNLYISGNPIKEIDFASLGSIRRVDISETQISRVDLMNAYYLQSFVARKTQIEFVDFNGCQINRMEKIDLRDNARMTAESVDYTLYTLPAAKQSYGSDPNLLLSGSNAEHARTSYATGIDMNWRCDVDGDGTVTHDLVDVTLTDATDTGDNITGHLDQLYPYYGMGFDYDFDLYSTSGGKFLISQWQPTYYQTMESVTDKALVGVPIHIYPYPEEGKRFKSVTVNGQEIASQWFIVSGPASIKVNFVNEESSISFTTTPGQALSFLVNTHENNGTVAVDWGTGTRTEYPGQNAYQQGYAAISGTRIDGSAAGPKITIYGDVAALDLSGFGDMAELLGLHDNKVSSIDLTNSNGLKLLNLYWNPITSINLSGATELDVLNVSYTALTSLDLSACGSIKWLEAYSDGYGDPDDGISQLTSIDVTNLPYLQYLDIKGNKISSIDLTKNGMLTWAYLQNNSISTIDLTKNPDLELLNISRNSLSTIDLTKNAALVELSVADNNMTSIDLGNNLDIEELSIANNDIHSLDLSGHTMLTTLYINGNGMSACELNDLYYLLPQRRDTSGEDQAGTSASWNLAVIQGGDRASNDGTRADSSIAADRGWTPSHAGSNGGCDKAYLDIISPVHGTVKVVDGLGNEYKTGDKVEKYLPLTIVAVPDQGYKMASFTLNGENPQTGTTFNMPGIYTKLAVSFSTDSGVEDVAAGQISVSSGNGHIDISGVTSDAYIEIYGISGILVYSGTVSHSTSIGVQAGIYIVKVTDADNAVINRISVK